MERTTRPAFRKIVLAGDGVILVASAFLARALHELLRDALPFLKAPPRFEAYAALAYLLLPLWLLLVVGLGLDRSFERRWTRVRLVIDVAKLHALALLGLTFLAFLTQAVVNRSLVATLLACTFVLMAAERLALGAWVRRRHEGGEGRERVLLVGGPSETLTALVRDAAGEAFPPQFVGRLAEEEPPAAPGACDLPPLLGVPADLDRVLHEQVVDQVLFLPPHHQRQQVQEALAVCEARGVGAHLWLDLAPTARTAPRLATLFDRPFASYRPAPKRPEALAVKQVLDIFAAGLAMLIAAPAFLLASLLIWTTMGRPILFRQERVGLNGRRFALIKFRTMVRDAESRKALLEAANEMDGPVFKMRGDPRVTPLGRLLRRLSLDELPQLWNVLTGSMSLVGPRPLPVAEQQQIRGEQRRRLAMKPGLTGLWQVSGRSSLPFEEWMRLDLLYVDHWSLGLDLRILLRTVVALFSGRGAR